MGINVTISQVDAAFRDHAGVPDVLYCAAGGNHAQNGFLHDITADQLDACMRNNYFATAYPAKSILDVWIQDDKKHGWQGGPRPRSRQIVIVSSAAAFVGLPGSIAYTRKSSAPSLVLRSKSSTESGWLTDLPPRCSCKGGGSSPGRHAQARNAAIFISSLHI